MQSALCALCSMSGVLSVKYSGCIAMCEMHSLKSVHCNVCQVCNVQSLPCVECVWHSVLGEQCAVQCAVCVVAHGKVCIVQHEKADIVQCTRCTVCSRWSVWCAVCNVLYPPAQSQYSVLIRARFEVGGQSLAQMHTPWEARYILSP